MLLKTILLRMVIVSTMIFKICYLMGLGLVWPVLLNDSFSISFASLKLGGHFTDGRV